ncbi:hypothetical protein Cgig2_025042 [Carnegiea gigantea]|uniref:Uncharacterized protein n=1 Tax=Carnegiea gigantea TaxID=171969 RepID=A0A9Q1GKZ1_9CARY|nr:hypothetical protein Cgig2_025042 [Carnegiea gigantea]
MSDDSDDANFNEAEQEAIEEYDDTSLDEESFSSNEGLDDMELEFDAESRMDFGREISHGEGDRNLVVNKISKGTISALNKVMLTARRRVCVIHLYKTLHQLTQATSYFHAYFYIATNAYSAYVHGKAMEQIKEKDAPAYHWLKDTEPLGHWARFKFDHTLKSTDNTNNFVESFNHAILNFRGKPILTMLEDITKLIGGSGRPCKHATRCILRVKDKLEDYCDDWFKVEKYRKFYDTIVHPISTTSMWENRTLPELDAQYSQVRKGRPEEHKRRLSQPLPPARAHHLVLALLDVKNANSWDITKLPMEDQEMNMGNGTGIDGVICPVNFSGSYLPKELYLKPSSTICYDH